MSRTLKHAHRGFTLIELMIVVAIVGILAAIGVPAYEGYIARAQASEAFSLANGMKTAIAEQCQAAGSCANNITVLASTGKYVDLTSDANGEITAVFNAAATTLLTGDTVTLTPTLGVGSVTWVCAGTLDARFKPKSCT